MSKRTLIPEYRALANPRNFAEFLYGNGVLAQRQAIADEYGYDWHARKLEFASHFRGHVLMQATAYRSTRDHQWAAKEDPLFLANGAGVEISVSGLAQANRSRPLEPLMIMAQQVTTAVAQLPHRKLRALDKQTWQSVVQLLQRADIFDATTLKLPPKLAKWTQTKKADQAQIKLQLRIDGWRGDFKKIMLTPEAGSDSPYFSDLLGDLQEQQDQIFIFDGGYWKIDTYHAIVDSGNDFVTKRGGTTKPKVVKELSVPAGPLSSEYEVVRDTLAYLGERKDTLFRMLIVRQTNGEEIMLLSSLVGLSADEICLLYRYRWTIEILFRWLRQTLELEHFQSHDPIGIIRQILVALIVWDLLVIANQDSSKLSPKHLWRQLQADIHMAAVEFGYQLGFQGAISALLK